MKGLVEAEGGGGGQTQEAVSVCILLFVLFFIKEGK